MWGKQYQTFHIPLLFETGFQEKKKTWAKNKFAWGPYEWTFGTYRIDNPFTYFL